MEDSISRQAAIDLWDKYHPYIATKAMAYDRELRALPSVQPEPCEDAVSRQRLLNDLKELITAWEKYPVMAEQIKGVKTAIGYVAAIPSVTPKRKTGKWLDNYQYGYKCSECGAYLEIDCGDVEMNFCPNCGADMNSLPEPYKPKEKNDACD